MSPTEDIVITAHLCELHQFVIVCWCYWCYWCTADVPPVCFTPAFMHADSEGCLGLKHAASTWRGGATYLWLVNHPLFPKAGS